MTDHEHGQHEPSTGQVDGPMLAALARAGQDLSEIPRSTRDSHLAAIVAAATGSPAPTAGPAGGSAVSARVRRVLGLTAVKVALGAVVAGGAVAGLATADRLPDPAQRVVSNGARLIGIDLPSPDDPATTPRPGTAPGGADPSPAEGGDGSHSDADHPGPVPDVPTGNPDGPGEDADGAGNAPGAPTEPPGGTIGNQERAVDDPAGARDHSTPAPSARPGNSGGLRDDRPGGEPPTPTGPPDQRDDRPEPGGSPPTSRPEPDPTPSGDGSGGNRPDPPPPPAPEPAASEPGSAPTNTGPPSDPGPDNPGGGNEPATGSGAGDETNADPARPRSADRRATSPGPL